MFDLHVSDDQKYPMSTRHTSRRIKRPKPGLMAIAAIWLGACGGAAMTYAEDIPNYGGQYEHTGSAGTMTLDLQQTANQVVGRMTDVRGKLVGVAGEVKTDGRFTGVAMFGQRSVQLAGMFEQDVLVWTLMLSDDPKPIRFHRITDATSAPNTVPTPQTHRRYRSPTGSYSMQVPDTWRLQRQGDGFAVFVQEQLSGSVLMLCGELDRHEIDQPVDTIVQAHFGDIDELLREDGILSDSEDVVAQVIRQDAFEGAYGMWSGLRHDADGSVPMVVWTGATVRSDTYVAMVAIVDQDMTDEPWQVGIRKAFKSITIHHEGLHAVPVDGVIYDKHAPRSRHDTSADGPIRQVYINRTRVDDTMVHWLEVGMGVQIPDGSYWYDRMCGAVGHWGGPAIAFFPAGLGIGGPLPFDASGGKTNVTVNGRALHAYDMISLMSIVGRVIPGRYWLDAQSNFGLENGPTLGNLIAMGQRRAGAGSASYNGSGAWTRYTDFGGDNGRTHMGSFGGGDFYFSSGGTSWWPGK